MLNLNWASNETRCQLSFSPFLLLIFPFGQVLTFTNHTHTLSLFSLYTILFILFSLCLFIIISVGISSCFTTPLSVVVCLSCHKWLEAVWPDIKITNSPIFVKSYSNCDHRRFCYKEMFFKCLGNFCTKICHQELKKIAQSGHTDWKTTVMLTCPIRARVLGQTYERPYRCVSKTWF